MIVPLTFFVLPLLPLHLVSEKRVISQDSDPNSVKICLFGKC